MADKIYRNRCGNCAFHRPVEKNAKSIECIYGGQVSEPMGVNHPPCLWYRPSVKELRRRGQMPTPPPKKKKNAEPYVKVDGDYVTWTDEMDARLKELFYETLNTIGDIAEKMGLSKKVVTNRIHDLGMKRKRSVSVISAQALINDGKKIPVSEQKWPRIKPCKGYCCKYKEQCAHYHHWLELGKPQFGTIASVSTCINVSYHLDSNYNTPYAYKEFLSLDMKSRTPELVVYTETC